VTCIGDWSPLRRNLLRLMTMKGSQGSGVSNFGYQSFSAAQSTSVILYSAIFAYCSLLLLVSFTYLVSHVRGLSVV
jgi:hypothetical protein